LGTFFNTYLRFAITAVIGRGGLPLTHPASPS
jgi:hypothetical protein